MTSVPRVDIMDSVPDERSPFDLSCAIELLRSLSWYHPTTSISSTESESESTATTTTITTTTTTSNTLLLHQEAKLSIPRRNPFLDILSSDGSVDSGKGDDEPVTLPKGVHKPTHAKTPSTSSISTQKRSRKRSPVKEPIASVALSAIQRRTGFLKTLKELDKGLKLPPNPAVHVFVDYSNISIGFYDSVKKLLDSKKPHRPSNGHTHLSFKTLALILERGRPAAKKVLVGSTRNNDLKSEAQDLNYEVSILQRVPKEKQDSNNKSTSRGYASEPEQSRKRTGEQAVDEVLIMKILESLLDCTTPATIVLATGDGNITQFSEGFFKSVERALEKGWNVELIAFKRTLSKSWKKLICPQFRVILLDGFLLDLLQ
ncbi:hypothetical protein TWF281_009809 [Arthrobotrys megalospora]